MASLATGSGSTDLFLSKRFLFDKMKESGETKLDNQFIFLKKYLVHRTNCAKTNIKTLNKKISHFISDFKRKWAKARRLNDRFLTQNASWLDSSIGFPTYVCAEKTGAGRPKVDFMDSSERSKRMKTQLLRSQTSTEELSYATQMSLRSSGQSDASKLIKEITTTSPKRATRYRAAFKDSLKTKRDELSPEEALAMFVDAKLTRHQYNIIREKDKERFPSYKIIQEAKKGCYPKQIVVTDLLAEVKLQGLLNHTASRLLQVQQEVITRQENLQRIWLISKWGFDGSSGQSEYKQKFSSGPSYSDASIFLTSLVPLKLISGDPDGPAKHQVVLWSNDRPSSTRYCRPIRFQLAHESTDLTKIERDYIEEQIKDLVPSIYEDQGRIIEVHHRLLFTMVDGKVCNALTNTTSTMKCYICGLTSKDFNNIEKCMKANISQTTLKFGISVLHAWIRFFECLLHLSYKLPIKKWQARGAENKLLVESTKSKIQEEFKSRLGLVIDKPKPGYGNSNDGNTARRFFENAEVSSEILGVDIELIKRFRTILKTLASGFDINLALFKKYAIETAKLFIEKYAWYPMPPTVHKVLIHGPTIIEEALLPIGQLSEEAQEANNKEYKSYRERFSRKFSREDTNTDVLNRLLISSDPLISSMHRPPRRKRILEKNVLELLEPAPISEDYSDSEDSN